MTTVAGKPGSPAAIYHFLMDAARAIMSCPIRRCEKRVKGLQETGLPAMTTDDQMTDHPADHDSGY